MTRFKDDITTVAMRAMAYLIVPAMVEGLANTATPNQKNGESWLGWGARALAGEIPAGIPIVRDIAKAALNGRAYEMSPAAHAIDSVIQFARKDVPSIWDSSKATTPKLLQHALETGGYLTGVGTGSFANASQYVFDVLRQHEQPQDAGEFMRAVLFGRPAKTTN